jgi:hypothetical protein
MLTLSDGASLCACVDYCMLQDHPAFICIAQPRQDPPQLPSHEHISSLMARTQILLLAGPYATATRRLRK